MDKVSIVTVDYNQPDVTLELLESLKQQDYDNLEVIVVDNGSKNNSRNRILNLYPETIFIRSEKNLGFAGGNNLGIKKATGKYLFFVNNDTEIPSGTISQLVEAFHQYPDSGAICPVINYYHHPELTQYAGYTPINTLTGRNRAIGYREQVKLENIVEETSFAHGAAMMVPKVVIRDVGMMPENYFLYYEELDWAAHMKTHFYKIRVVKAAYVLHKESVSTGKSSPLKTYFQTRNRILFMRRNFGFMNQLAFYLFFVLLALPKSTLKFLLRGEVDHLKSFLNGVIWNLREPISSVRIGYKYEFLRQ
ncbi:MAG: glycosyltransferase family 2 protein [Marinoscillum sp.]